MKLIILILLGYTMYLGHRQATMLQMKSPVSSPEANQLLQKNIIASYVFIFFIGLIFIYVIKSLF